MEFKLNKIEMDVRQKINQETSMDKVHTKKGIEVNKDKSHEMDEKVTSGKKNNAHHENNSEHKQDESDENKKDQSKMEDPYKGHFIDIMK